jgi:hypothetical protein
MSQSFDESQQMLCLAALSYRRFEESLQGWIHVERVRDAVHRGLRELAPICGEWVLVWGPVAYRAPFSLFDDNVMFVLRSKKERRYVVVVRGTNPPSAFDWVFGDFWVTVQVPWPYGARNEDPGAKISLSTLMGLNMLQMMQAPRPRDAVAAIFHDIADATGDALDDIGAVLRPLQGPLVSEVRAIRDQALPVLAQLDTVRRSRARRDQTTHVLGLLDDWRSATRRHAIAQLCEAVGALANEQSFNLLRFLERSGRLDAAIEPGTSLLRFLAAAVSEASPHPIDVVVTGHSKGGALASTVALWLADTQGEAHVDEAFRWDRRAMATVRCYSYAGPTAGNDAFAARSDRVLGGRCQRVFNTLDVVPHAWNASDLGRIDGLYPTAPPIDLLRELIDEIRTQVEPLGYTQIGVARPLEGEVEPTLRDFFLQFVHQHLAEYLRAMKLDTTNVLTFFSPVA